MHWYDPGVSDHGSHMAHKGQEKNGVEEEDVEGTPKAKRDVKPGL